MAPELTPHGLDPARYAVVDDELARAEAYFTRLRDELRDKASADDTNVLITEGVLWELAMLRFELQREQQHQGHEAGPLQDPLAKLCDNCVSTL